MRRNPVIASKTVSSKYIDVWFPEKYFRTFDYVYDVPTPLPVHLTHQHMGDTPRARERHRTCLHVLGRTIRTSCIEEDNLQIAPCFIGLGGTGKSMISEIVQELFHIDMVGNLSSTMQETFGLVGLTDRNGVAKQVCIINEFGEKSKIPQPTFLTLLSNEKIEVTNKGRMLAGSCGKGTSSLRETCSRRTTETMQSDRSSSYHLSLHDPVLKKDTTLKHRIIDQELRPHLQMVQLVLPETLDPRKPSAESPQLPKLLQGVPEKDPRPTGLPAVVPSQSGGLQ